jgi:hypothetical protein
VKEEPSLLVDHIQRGGAIFEDLAQLALLLGHLRLTLGQGGDIVHPAKAFAADKADMTTLVGDLNVRDQQVDESTLLRLPNHLLI